MKTTLTPHLEVSLLGPFLQQSSINKEPRNYWNVIVHPLGEDALSQSCKTYKVYKEDAAQMFCSKISKDRNIPDLRVNGYKITFNELFGEFIVSHPEIGACVEYSKDIDYLINYCLRG